MRTRKAHESVHDTHNGGENRRRPIHRRVLESAGRLASRAAAKIDRAFEGPYNKMIRRAAEQQERPLPEGSPVARAQALLDQLEAVRDARETAQGRSIIRSRESAVMHPQEPGRPSEPGVAKRVSLHIDPSGEFGRRSDYDSHDASAIRLLRPVQSPFSSGCTVETVSLDRGTYVDPRDDSISDSLSISVLSIGRDGYKRVDTLSFNADAEGNFGDPVQTTGVRTSRAARTGFGGYESMPVHMMPDQAGVNQNLANVLGMLDGVMATQLQAPQPAVAGAAR